MELFKIHIEKMLSKYDISASGLALSFYAVGGTGKFTELRAFAKQYKSIINQKK